MVKILCDYFAEVLWIYRKYSYSKNRKIGRLPKNITNGIFTLYFHEPHNLAQIFSENSGEYVSLTKIEEHSYAFSVNGNEWIFNYKNGIVYKAEFDGIFNFTFHQTH